MTHEWNILQQWNIYRKRNRKGSVTASLHTEVQNIKNQYEQLNIFFVFNILFNLKIQWVSKYFVSSVYWMRNRRNNIKISSAKMVNVQITKCKKIEENSELSNDVFVFFCIYAKYMITCMHRERRLEGTFYWFWMHWVSCEIGVKSILT